MSSTVVSKNTYELLGNDPELDPEKATPQQPLNVKTQPVARPGKRGGPDERKTDGTFAAAKPATTTKPRDDSTRTDRLTDRTRGGNRERGGRGGRGGERGARGGREGAGRTNRDDRHSKTGISEHEKQAARGWGANTGEGEFADETNGLADAHKEEDADPIVADATPVDDEATPVPEEDKTVSYEQYLAEQASKREQLAAVAVRAANEGSNVKLPEGKPISRDEEEEDLIPAKHKQPRERIRTQTHKYETLDVDLAWKEQPQSAGGRGNDRGDRGGRGGRGGFRGDRGDGGRGRGDGARGGRGRGDGTPRARGDGPRGGRGGRGAAPNVTDDAAFPALG